MFFYAITNNPAAADWEFVQWVASYSTADHGWSCQLFHMFHCEMVWNSTRNAKPGMCPPRDRIHLQYQYVSMQLPICPATEKIRRLDRNVGMIESGILLVDDRLVDVILLGNFGVGRMTLIFLLVPGRITIHTNCLQSLTTEVKSEQTSHMRDCLCCSLLGNFYTLQDGWAPLFLCQSCHVNLLAANDSHQFRSACKKSWQYTRNIQ